MNYPYHVLPFIPVHRRIAMLNYRWHQYQDQLKPVKSQIIYWFFKNFPNSLNTFKYVCHNILTSDQREIPLFECDVYHENTALIEESSMQYHGKMSTAISEITNLLYTHTKSYQLWATPVWYCWDEGFLLAWEELVVWGEGMALSKNFLLCPQVNEHVFS